MINLDDFTLDGETIHAFYCVRYVRGTSYQVMVKRGGRGYFRFVDAEAYNDLYEAAKERDIIEAVDGHATDNGSMTSVYLDRDALVAERPTGHYEEPSITAQEVM